MTLTVLVRFVTYGGARMLFKASTAGPWGCDPCVRCDRRPAEGARVWQNSYGDLHCDACAEKYTA